jgi:hypothetical protein
VRTILLVAILSVSASPAYAVVVDFTNFPTLSTTGTLTIGGVTIAGTDVSIVHGVGLGSSSVLGAGTLDHQMTITIDENGMPHRQSQVDQPLSVGVDGFITALTVQAYFYDPSGTLELNVPMMIEPVSDGWLHTWFQASLNPVAPTTFTWAFEERGEVMPPNHIDYMWANGTTVLDVIAYAYANRGIETTLNFGFSIVSLEYTPRHVPEPTTLSLLTIGGACCLLKRRARREGAR